MSTKVVVTGSDSQQLIEYYAARAPTFDEMYFDHPPEYLREVAALTQEVEEFSRGRRVLELACGTGHWTQFAARTARSVLATDACEPMLSRARLRDLPASVEIRLCDAFTPPQGDFDAVLAAFWLSHVPRSRLRELLTSLPRGSALLIPTPGSR